MRVRCVDNDNGTLNLTIGKEYEISREKVLISGTLFLLTNDKNESYWYGERVFELVGTEEKTSPMTADEYQILASRTDTVICDANRLINGCLGLTGESGEVADIIKKHLFQGHELDKAHLAEELGDVLWYIASLCNTLEVKMSDVMQGNIDKLQKRYPDGFTCEKSVNRGEQDNG
jgi:NTP pyrophosphatase (non-canonical NTP hydrolase)